jgi:REP element-mobilizing transposase RayT
MRAPTQQSDHDYLRRLAPDAYCGNAVVHWTMATANRGTGWLDDRAHALWREVLLHALSRYLLAAPVYCLMPDHVHLLLVGLGADSDQRRAISFLRRFTARMFANVAHGWQKQAYDHVLRENERGRDAFQTVMRYITENPVRAGLASVAPVWRFSGSLVAGWPHLDWRQRDFWERWWRIYASIGAESGSATLP